jgi:integrase
LLAISEDVCRHVRIAHPPAQATTKHQIVLPTTSHKLTILAKDQPVGKCKRGRKRGKHNKGYHYRRGRGWYALHNGKRVPLVYPNGQHIQDKDVDPGEVKNAYRRWQEAQKAADEAAQAALRGPRPADSANISVAEVCNAFLSHVAATGAKSTFYNRANTLFDFCHALPAKFRPKNGKEAKYTNAEIQETKKLRCKHPPYGAMPVAKLTPLHVDAWLDAHPTWKNSRRNRIQALKRALNYAVERHMIPESPIARYRVGRSRGRITYFTPEQEAALLRHANPSLAMAIRVCIRTGLRYGAELVPLTASQIVDMGDRMEWRVAPKKTKKSEKYRLVRVTDPEIMKIARQQMEKYPSGPIFRNSMGNPWKADNLTVLFTNCRRRVEKKEGIQFDSDACMNTCRHTYAKRALQGHWTGKPTTIETLARLMGNTPQVCWDHYVQWCDAYNASLWEAC